MADNVQTQPDPQQIYLDQLRAEAAALPDAERAEQEAMIASLAGELSLTEAVRQEADFYVQRAKHLAKGLVEGHKETVDVPVDLSKIGWLNSEEVTTIQAEPVHSAGLDYLFVNLTSLHRTTTKSTEKLEKQGELAAALGKVKQEGIPVLWTAIISGRNQERPISMGNRRSANTVHRSLKTAYPGYKIDVFGGNNRAIILILDKQDEKPVIGLAALYDHADQPAIVNSLFKSPSRKSQIG